MVDALPYLADYPYDCTEQTLNRFLPTVITQKILIRMGLDLKKIQEKRTNLNAQEIGDDRLAPPAGSASIAIRCSTTRKSREMVKAGVERLQQMQLADGGWGWFSGVGEQSYPHTTATVVHGLQVAKANDVALVPGVLERGVEWLKRYQAAASATVAKRLGQAGSRRRRTRPRPTISMRLVYMVLIDAGVKKSADDGFSLSRPNPSGRVCQGAVWPGTGEARRIKKKNWR